MAVSDHPASDQAPAPLREPRGASVDRWLLAAAGALLASAVLAPAAARLTPLGPALSLAIVFVALALCPRVARALPRSLDGVVRRRPVVCALWVLLWLVATAQSGRLSAFMGDASRRWGSTLPDPEVVEHQCLSAYVHAAELSRREPPVANLYDERYYPAYAWRPGATAPPVTTTVANLRPWIDDPYEYPPPFLLLPRLALALSGDFLTIRAAWYLLQALLVGGLGLALAVRVGGRSGIVVGVLMPLVLASMPTMLTLQFGQFHAVAMALAAAAMVAFERRRDALGGALLASAVLAKLFPGILLVTLVAQRRYRAVAWTAGWCVALSVLALLVLGAAPFVAFMTYHLPRIASGEAFAFFQRELFFVSRNYSVYGIVVKLRALGVPGMTDARASVLSWLYTLPLVALAWRAGGSVVLPPSSGTPLRDTTRRVLALLVLASLRSPLVPSAYGVVPALWVLVLLAPDVRRPREVAAFALAWLLVMGAPPLPHPVDMSISLVAQAFLVGVCVWVLVRRPAPTSAP